MKKFLSIGAAATLLLLSTTATFADSQSGTGNGTQVNLTAGSLVLNADGVTSNFPDTQLTGVQQTAYANMAGFTVTDGRGSGAGWKLTIAASQFTDSSSHKFPEGSLSVKSPSITCNGTVAAGDCSNSSITPAFSTATGIDSALGTEVTVADATADSGLGKYNVSLGSFGTGNMKLIIPGNAYANAYSSTVTITLYDAP